MVAPALIATLGLLLVLLLFRPPGWAMLLFLVALFLPGRWWHWKTRRFRRGLRQLKRGDAGEARSEFEAFLFHFVEVRHYSSTHFVLQICVPPAGSWFDDTYPVPSGS